MCFTAGATGCGDTFLIANLLKRQGDIAAGETAQTGTTSEGTREKLEATLEPMPSRR